jgi:CBS domain-containing protein
MQLDDRLTVADVMSVDPVVVRSDATLEEAEELLRSYRIHGLPVVDDAGALVGVLSQTDLLWRAAPHLSTLLRANSERLRVAEIMTSPSITIPWTTSLGEAARVMADQRVHRLVVIDEHDRPTGVLSAMDYVHLVAEAAAPSGSIPIG